MGTSTLKPDLHVSKEPPTERYVGLIWHKPSEGYLNWESYYWGGKTWIDLNKERKAMNANAGKMGMTGWEYVQAIERLEQTTREMRMQREVAEHARSRGWIGRLIARFIGE